MATARRIVVEPGAPGWYQCICRCVRRAHLCGDGCEHRRGWLRDRLFELAALFEVDVAAYAVMSNHYHLQLYVAPDRVQRLDDREIARRWLTLFPGHRRDDSARPAEEDVQALMLDRGRLQLLRGRLGDLSWFMRCLNEWIARKANREDRCTGRFWEGRFKCRKLLDQAARLASAVYTDLNPIRAGMATTPESSAYTSIQERIEAHRSRQSFTTNAERAAGERSLWLLPMDERDASEERPAVAGIPLETYLQLVDETGRIVRRDKRGSIPAHLKPILNRLGIDESAWSRELAAAVGEFGTAVGSAVNRSREAMRRGSKWVKRVMDVYRHGDADSPR